MKGKTLAELAATKKEAEEIKADEVVEEKEKEDIAEKIKEDDAVRVLDKLEETEEEKFNKD